jgi:hypothetical protein
MVLSDLTLSGSSTAEEVKASLESKLSLYLPAGSYTIVLRSYQGDFRARSTSQPRFNAMFLLSPDGKKAALQNKTEMESLGFRVSASGDISLN